jgi:serine/threonine-protein kinase
VSLPDLRGTSVGDAQQILSGLGLTSTVRNQVDDSVPAGTVLGTDPAADSAVPAGSSVVLVVAVAPATSNPPQPSKSPSPTPTSNG